jgi:ABC-type transporter Mla subunit MlaD
LDKISNEVKIGITVVIAIVLAYLGFRVMRDVPLFSTSKVLYTKFDDVTGLLPGNIVVIKGYKIGSVKEMRFLQVEDSTLVTLNINEEIQIPVGSIATIISPGPIGAKYVEIRKSDADEYLQNGDYIDGVFGSGILEEIAEKGGELTDDVISTIKNLDTLLVGVNNTLDKDSQANIRSSIANISKSTDALNSVINRSQDDITQMIESVNRVISDLDTLSGENRENLDSIIHNLESTSAELEKLSTELNATTLTLNEILDKINSGEGTLGKMVSDPSLYNNLDSLSYNLSRLVRNIDENPRKYLRHLNLVNVF